MAGGSWSLALPDSVDGFPYQVDGDYLGQTERLEFVHRPDAVRLIRPAAR